MVSLGMTAGSVYQIIFNRIGSEYLKYDVGAIMHCFLKNNNDEGLNVDLAFMLSSLPCLHTFWRAIPTSLMFFISCTTCVEKLDSILEMMQVYKCISFRTNPCTRSNVCTSNRPMAEGFTLSYEEPAKAANDGIESKGTTPTCVIVFSL